MDRMETSPSVGGVSLAESIHARPNPLIQSTRTTPTRRRVEERDNNNLNKPQFLLNSSSFSSSSPSPRSLKRKRDEREESDDKMSLSSSSSSSFESLPPKRFGVARFGGNRPTSAPLTKFSSDDRQAESAVDRHQLKLIEAIDECFTRMAQLLPAGIRLETVGGDLSNNLRFIQHHPHVFAETAEETRSVNKCIDVIMKHFVEWKRRGGLFNGATAVSPYQPGSRVYVPWRSFEVQDVLRYGMQMMEWVCQPRPELERPLQQAKKQLQLLLHEL